MSNGRAIVRVRMEVEVEVGVWNDTESFKTLQAQAAKEAKVALNGVLGKAGRSKFRIIGEPSTMRVILEGEIEP